MASAHAAASARDRRANPSVELTMVESAHNHDPPEKDGAKRLDWSVFLARFFPNRRRHDFEALAAYEAYRNRFAQGLREGRTESHEAGVESR